MAERILAENDKVKVSMMSDSGITVMVENKITGERCSVAIGEYYKSATFWIKQESEKPKYSTYRF